MEQIIVFVKIINLYFERRECFSVFQFRSVESNSVRIKVAETLDLPVFHSKHTASYTG